MKIAIDGPAGCGKSTIAKLLSERLGILYLNSGNLYRAISFKLIESGIGLSDPDAGALLAERLAMIYNADGSVTVEGRRLASELRSSDVDAIVAQVSAIPRIRAVVNRVLRTASEGKDVVAEGRDITTVVFPDAEVKFYLDASVEERAKRRFLESERGNSLERIMANIAMRDGIDKNKEVGALKRAPDAVYLDTSGLTIDRVYEKVYSKILHVREAHGE